MRERLFDEQSAPARIGRYVLLESIGSGGMGRVHAAYDEQLDRKVAIKLLLPQMVVDETIRLRFLREAQAMARLSHPNVVTVHEVGESDGEVFLAMEFIRGQSVRAWLKTSPEWSQIVETFLHAGRGVVAAHHAGLIHRDLKPANIMRDDQGAVKVLDFGLARLAEPRDADESDDLADSAVSMSSVSSRLTQTNTVMGTPAYMAPEQLLGEVLDARTDQYSFCVALWEGLTGECPFVGDDFDTLVESKLAGAPAWPASAPPVPRTIVEALRRGLAPAAEGRWPSMESLLLRLAGDPARRRNRWLLGLAGLGVVALGGGTIQQWTQTRAQRCSGAERHLAGVWDEARRAEVESAVLGINRPYAHQVYRRALDGLDDYADAWQAAHTEACEATAERGEQSDRVLDLRMRCMARAAQELRATVDTLAAADEVVVSHGDRLVADLRPLSQCGDLEALEAGAESPPLPRDEAVVATAREAIASANTLRVAGRYEAALGAVATATDVLEGVDYEPIWAELSVTKGKVLSSLGRYDEATQVLLAALEKATRVGDQRLQSRASRSLMLSVGVGQQRVPDALALRPIVLGATVGDAVEEARARRVIASVLLVPGEYERAEAELREALALQMSVSEPSPLDIARIRHSLGNVLARRGKYEAALAESQAVLEIRREVQGPDHPATASIGANVGMNLIRLGRYDDADTELRAALAAQRDALAPNHPQIARTRNALGNLAISRGDPEQAEHHHAKALAARLATFSPSHTDVIESRVNLAATMLSRQEYLRAETEYRAVLEVLPEALGPDHHRVGDARRALGLTLANQGKLEAAEAEYRQALPILVQALGPTHPNIAWTHSYLGQTLHAQQRLEEAAAELRVALEIWRQEYGPDHFNAWLTRGRLGAVLIDQGRYEEAEHELRAAMAGLDPREAADEEHIAWFRVNLARVLGQHGKREEAEQEARAGLAGLRPGSGSARTGQAQLAECLLALDRGHEALDFAEAAWIEGGYEDDAPEEMGRRGYLLARILWSLDGPERDRAAANDLAQVAVRVYRRAGEPFEERAREVERWLHRRGR